MFLKHKVFLFLIFICAIFCAGGVSVAKDNSPVKRVKLKNGLTVILEPNSAAPVAAINVWVKVGSSCERDDERGLAHFHEHMLFKGTNKLGPGELASEVESAGGRINAYTSFDQTVYFIVSGARSLGRSIDLLADSVTDSVFDPAELDREIEVVVEEIRRSKDNPSDVAGKRLFETAYKKHPYGFPILGTEKSVRAFTREKVLNFYRKWYVPGNMVVVVTGDFETDKVLSRVKKRFGSLKSRAVPKCFEQTAPPRRSAPAVSVLKRRVQEGYFSLAFRIPGTRDEDIAALEVISEIMGGGESSRLFRTVKEEKGIVNSVYSYAYAPTGGGVFVVGGTVKPENSSPAFEEILKMFYALADGRVQPSEIDKAKLNIESENIRADETTQGRARTLGFYEAIAGDYMFEDEYMDRVRSVSAEDIRRVAAKYFKPSNLSAVALVPQSSGVSERGLKKAVRSVKPVSVRAQRRSKTGVHRLKNGMRVIVKENKSVPLFSARLLFPGGLRFEDEKLNGISNFAANMLTRGTQSRSAEQIAAEMESLGGYVEGFSGRDSAGVSMEAFSSNFDAAMDIFSDVALNPSFPDEEIKRAKREILAAINRRKDDLSSVCIDGFLSTLFKGTPYSRSVTGTEKNVRSFTRSSAEKFYKKILNPKEMVLVVVGDVDTRKVLKRLEDDFSSLRAAKKAIPLPVRVKPAGKPVEAVKKLPSKQQTHIVVGFTAPPFGHADHYPVQVLNAVLSGQGGRLFIKLRDEMSLAYSVSSFYAPRVESGIFGVHIGTAPQKEQKAIGGIIEQLEAVLENGVSTEEVKRAQRRMAGDFEIGLQRNSAQASVMGFDELYGVGWDEYRDFVDRVFAVTAEDVLRVAKKYINLDSRVVSVVRGEGGG